MKKLLIALFALFVAVGVVGEKPARANVGQYLAYVCFVEYNPQDDTGAGYGSAGYIRMVLTTAQGCGGTTLGGVAQYIYICSTGATNVSCVANKEFTVATLPFFFLALWNQMNRGHYIQILMDDSYQPWRYQGSLQFR